MKKLIIVSGFIFLNFIQADEKKGDGVTWVDNFNPLRIEKDRRNGWYGGDEVEAEKIENGVRLTKLTSSSHGLFERYLQYKIGDFLQINLKETSGIKLAVSNGSLKGTALASTLISGITTISLQNQPASLCISFFLVGDQGCSVDLESVKLIQNPINALTIQWIEGDEVFDASFKNSDLLISYHAEERFLKEKLEVTFINVKSMKEINLPGFNKVFLNDDGVDGDKVSGDLIYSYVFKNNTKTINNFRNFEGIVAELNLESGSTFAPFPFLQKQED